MNRTTAFALVAAGLLAGLLLRPLIGDGIAPAHAKGAGAESYQITTGNITTGTTAVGERVLYYTVGDGLWVGRHQVTTGSITPGKTGKPTTPAQFENVVWTPLNTPRIE